LIVFAVLGGEAGCMGALPNPIAPERFGLLWQPGAAGVDLSENDAKTPVALNIQALESASNCNCKQISMGQIYTVIGRISR